MKKVRILREIRKLKEEKNSHGSIFFVPTVGVQKKRITYSEYIVLSLVEGLCNTRKKERCRDIKVEKYRKRESERETKRKQEKYR